MCQFAKYDSEKDIYNCEIIEDECLLIVPDKKTCDSIFGGDKNE